MQIQLIRSATIKVTMAGHTFIIDPYLASKHTMPSYTGASSNPLVNLPISTEEVLAGCEMAVISHLHSDHFDPTAQHMLSKTCPLFCQPGDEGQLRGMNFSHISPVGDSIQWLGIRITRTLAQHGSGRVLDDMGEASGFLFEAEGELTLYWAGDTVLTPEVHTTITRSQPEVIVTHSGGAVWGDRVPIIMNAEQTIALCQAAPTSLVIATHMEALDHCTVSRSELRAAAENSGIQPYQLLIPDDGETIQI